jgi:hypothetical protein
MGRVVGGNDQDLPGIRGGHDLDLGKGKPGTGRLPGMEQVAPDLEDFLALDAPPRGVHSMGIANQFHES